MFTLGKRFACGLAIAVLGVAVAGATPARAQEQEPVHHPSPWYLRLGAGYEHRGSAHEKTGSAALTFNPGFLVSTAVGYKFSNMRLEAESAYFDNPVDVAAVTHVFAEKASGNVGVQSYLLNLYYDIKMRGHSEHKLAPYVGAGVGFMQSSINSLATPTLLHGIPNPAGGFYVNPNSIISATSQWDLASQIGFGANYALNDKTGIYLGYRYIRGNGYFRFDTTSFGTFRPNAAAIEELETGVTIKI